MNKQTQGKFLKNSERGQAIIIVAFAIIGLIAMVGLVTDTGILLIEYGKLKRGVDAAAIAAAQQYRQPTSGTELDQAALENAAKNFLQLNQATDIVSVVVHSCESPSGERPALCNPDPEGHPNDNRKLVEVVASKNVYFGFLRVIGIDQTTVAASSTGEAATIDLVLVIDTSGSMAYETDADIRQSAGDDPSFCNDVSNNTPCQPLQAVKDVALDFLDTLYFPYDRVAVVSMTSQTPGGDRDPMEVLALNSDKDTVRNAIIGLKVFEPRVCDPDNIEPGSCLTYNGSGAFVGTACQSYEAIWNNPDITDAEKAATADPSSCPSSNVGGALDLARRAFTEDPAHTRLDAFWVVVSLLGGPANATNADMNPVSQADSTPRYPNGYCPANTWLPTQLPWCRDRRPSVRHHDTDPLVSYTNPLSGETRDISLYDADDYARDMADTLATAVSGNGVTVFTIGLGAQIRSTSSVEAGESPAAEALLQYIAECAGDNCGTTINHGQYFYAPTSTSLAEIFDRIAKNIATKISQ